MLVGTSTTDPRAAETIETYEMYELAGTEEYSGVRARLYASKVKDCASRTTACPRPTNAGWPGWSMVVLIFRAEQVDRLDDGAERVWTGWKEKKGEEEPRTTPTLG